MTKRDYGPQANPLDFNSAAPSGKGQEFYDEIKERFRMERDIRLGYRPPGSTMYRDFSGDLADYETDPYAEELPPREALQEEVEVLFIGGGFSALLTSARLKDKGVDSIRIIERGGDFGGSWYWNRYPGVACDIISFDYLPLLDETGYIPSRRYARGDEIFAYCRQIGEKYDLYRHAVFQTTVVSTVWNEKEKIWHVSTDRGDQIKVKFVICANGPLAKPKVALIEGINDFRGKSFHTSRWDYDYTGKDLEGLADKKVAVIGTGASAVQVVAALSKKVGELYVFQRPPSAVFNREDWETEADWAATLKPGWQAARRQEAFAAMRKTQTNKAKYAGESRDEKLRRLENANIDTMMMVHDQIDQAVEDPDTAAALKPWYMLLCKRPCIHSDYLPSFNLPNVYLIDTKGKGVTKITNAGPEFDGEVYDVDLIVYTQWRWHVDECFVKINGETHYLWRAVDHEGEVLESYVTKRRDKSAALAFFKKTLKRHGSPVEIVTDGLKSYLATLNELGIEERRRMGRWENNRVENAHLPLRRRERIMQRFRRMKSLQKFALVHASIHNHFNSERHFVDRQTYKTRRSAVLAEWQNLAA